MTGSSSAPPWKRFSYQPSRRLETLEASQPLMKRLSTEVHIQGSITGWNHVPQSERQASGWGGTTALAGQWGSILKNVSHIAGF